MGRKLKERIKIETIYSITERPEGAHANFSDRLALARSMGISMKKTILITLLLVFTLSMIVPTMTATAIATAASDGPNYTITVPTRNSNGTYSFQIIINKPDSFDAYSGVAFWIRLPNGIKIVTVSYSLADGKAWAPEEAPGKPGNYNCGYWAENNIFTDAITCTFNVEYTGKSDISLTVTEIAQNIYKEEIGSDQLIAKPNALVLLSPVNAEPTPPEEEKNDKENNNGKEGSGGGTVNSRPIPGAAIDEIDTPLEAIFPFIDVLENNWFYPDVFYMWQNGLMNGTSETTFDPGGKLTRGMVVTVLWRMEGSPNVDDLEMPFSDVPNTWYYDAVKWAVKNGIVTGYPDDTYCPDNIIYRQDLALIICRYAAFAESELTASREYAVFNDNSEISAYAKDAVETLYKSGIINGKPDNLFDPKGSATRADFAAMLHRFLLIGVE